jgi:molecular chaperone DnaK
MIKEAEENAEADRTTRELIETRNQADSILANVRSELKEASLSSDSVSKIESACTVLEDAIKGDDRTAIIQAISDLNVASVALRKSEENSSADDGIIDAEFTEAN